MILALMLCLQAPVQLPGYQGTYTVTLPDGYTDRKSWPVVLMYGGGLDTQAEPGAIVVTFQTKGNRLDLMALDSLTDVKTRYRVDPERVLLRGDSSAISLASERRDLFAGCAVVRARAFGVLKKCPPATFYIGAKDPDRGQVAVAAMIMKKSGIDVEVRDGLPGAGDVLASLAPRIKVRGYLPKADEYQRAGRWLDATLVCINLLDNPEVERLAKTKLKSIEGAAIIELAKVEVAASERKWKDAVLRCREAAKQFAWVPTGEKIKKRLGELESRPEVKKALATDD